MHLNWRTPARLIAPVQARQTCLCYGHYPTLLLTRQWMLRRIGYLSETVASDAEYQTQLSMAAPDIIILCHTLTAQECASASGLAAERCPQSHLLVLFTRTAKHTPQQQHVLLDTNDGPDAFSFAVCTLLNQRRNPLHRSTPSTSSSEAALSQPLALPSEGVGAMLRAATFSGFSRPFGAF